MCRTVWCPCCCKWPLFADPSRPRVFCRRACTQLVSRCRHVFTSAAWISQETGGLKGLHVIWSVQQTFLNILQGETWAVLPYYTRWRRRSNRGRHGRRANTSITTTTTTTTTSSSNITRLHLLLLLLQAAGAARCQDISTNTRCTMCLGTSTSIMMLGTSIITTVAVDTTATTSSSKWWFPPVPAVSETRKCSSDEKVVK